MIIRMHLYKRYVIRMSYHSLERKWCHDASPFWVSFVGLHENVSAK